MGNALNGLLDSAGVPPAFDHMGNEPQGLTDNGMVKNVEVTDGAPLPSVRTNLSEWLV